MRRHHWTPEQTETLNAMYADHTASDIAAVLGLHVRQVQAKAWGMGLKKTPEWIAERGRKVMADPNHPGRAYQFRPGLTPHNKGKPHPSRGRATETQFKPGHRPHTWRPIGANRVRSDGYLERKTADTGCTRRDYVTVHTLVWRMHGRSIPDGYALCFIDGDKRNFDINNLELVHRSNLMRRNSVHRHGPEIASAYQLLGAIKRQLSRKTKEITA